LKIFPAVPSIPIVSKERLEQMTISKKMKCIDNVFVNNYLTLDKVYDVVKTGDEYGEFYVVKDDLGTFNRYGVQRFVEVENLPDTPPSIPIILEDRKKEIDFFRASSCVNTCGKCGSPLPCNYHS
jgi:hypothetical protein